jgi:hypothetical protein
MAKKAHSLVVQDYHAVFQPKRPAKTGLAASRLVIALLLKKDFVEL